MDGSQGRQYHTRICATIATAVKSRKLPMKKL